MSNRRPQWEDQAGLTACFAIRHPTPPRPINASIPPRLPSLIFVSPGRSHITTPKLSHLRTRRDTFPLTT